MEHVFDTLSKDLARAISRDLARAISRREAMSTFVRSAVSAFLVCSGLTNRSLQAQSAACPVCGTCQTYNAATAELAPCTGTCQAQALCSSVQTNASYKLLQADLHRRSYTPKGYRALLYTLGTSHPALRLPSDHERNSTSSSTNTATAVRSGTCCGRAVLHPTAVLQHCSCCLRGRAAWSSAAPVCCEERDSRCAIWRYYTVR